MVLDNAKLVKEVAKNVTVFKDTMKACERDRELSASIIQSQADAEYISSERVRKKYGKPMEWTQEYDLTDVTFSRWKTLSAAERFAKTGNKTAILNFANAKHPGGGVTNGSIAQEEDLCRSSTLYPVLSSKYGSIPSYYKEGTKLTKGRQIGEAAVLYVPDIIVFRADMEDYRFFGEEGRFKVDVITCAAPQLRHMGDVPRDRQEEIHKKLGRAILNIAKEKGVDIVVLGAFGCGAFHNDPHAVAAAYRDLMVDFAGCFKKIHFAIFGKNDNYAIFKDAIIGDEDA